MTPLPKEAIGLCLNWSRACTLFFPAAALALLLSGCAPRITPQTANLIRYSSDPRALEVGAEITPFQTNIRDVKVSYGPGTWFAPGKVSAVRQTGDLWRATFPNVIHPDFRVDYNWLVTYRTTGYTGTATEAGSFWVVHSRQVELLSPVDRTRGVGTPTGNHRVSVELKWKPIPVARSYRLTVYEDGGPAPPTVLVTQRFGLTEPRHVLDNLGSWMPYKWWVEAEFDNADDPPRARGMPHVTAVGLKSPMWQFTTRSSEPVPAPPSDLTAVASGARRIELSWRNHATNASSILIERSTTGLPDSFRLAGEIPATETSTADVNQNDDVLPNTRYFYRVRSKNANGISDPSNIADATTAAEAGAAPAAPQNLTATATAATNVLLRWQVNSNNSGYSIERVIGRDTPFPANAEVGTAPGNVVGINDDSVAAGVVYKYRIRAFNVAGGPRVYSPYSNVVAVTTPGGVGGRTATQFVNRTSYPIISLVVDGVQYCAQEANSILPGGALEIPTPAGQHNYNANNGFWSNGTRIEMYSYSGTYTQQAGAVGQQTFNDPTIEQLLTRFAPAGAGGAPATGYWVGEYWTNTIINSRGFRFDGTGRYTQYDNSVVSGSGTYSMVRYPGNFLVTFRITAGNGVSHEGILDERNSTFNMTNGPAGWRTIHYIYDGR